MINCFSPIFDSSCRLLILGSCPSVVSLQKQEFYGHKQNRFWPVMFRMLGEKVCEDYEQKKVMLLRNNIGLWDVVGRCDRVGSMDNKISDVVLNDVAKLIEGTNVKTFAFNGGKAAALFKQKIAGVEMLPLPSTSPANAKMNFEDLFKAWNETLKHCIQKDEILKK